jgi:GDP-mannose pyrophosphatase NudK
MSKRVKITEEKILSDNWYTLKKVTFDYLRNNGQWQTQAREAYDRGNGAAILLFNRETKKVVLVKQFRVPTYMNGNADGQLIEVCAGVLDDQEPEACIIKEVQEETGFIITKATKVFEAYTSPGAVTEILHFFIAEYRQNDKITEGGGLEHEEEDIEVLEIPFKKAMKMMETGEIKDAKTMLLLQYAAIHKLLK